MRQETPKYYKQLSRRGEYFDDYDIVLPQTDFTKAPVCVGIIEDHNHLDQWQKERYWVGWHYTDNVCIDGKPATSAGPFDTEEQAVNFVFFGDIQAAKSA